MALSSELSCRECHQEVYQEILNYPYPHSNFVQNNCEGCHINGKIITLANAKRNRGFFGGGFFGSKQFKTVLRANSYKKPIEKFQGTTIKFPDYSLEHMAVLDNLERNSTYKVKIRLTDRSGKQNQSEIISFDPDAITEFLVDDETPAIIKRLGISRIESSVLSTAEIVWNTDKSSDSMVEYGLTEKYEDSSYSSRYSRQHKIILNGIDNNKIYHYRVISIDPFGNKSISGDYSFDTSSSFNRNLKTLLINSGMKSGMKPIFRMIKVLKLKRANRDENIDENIEEEGIRVAILYSSSKEVKSSIEYTEEKRKEIVNLEGEGHGNGGLKTKREAGLETCKKCHYQGPAAHPVGITSSRFVKVSQNLPTAEGGIMTCVTCHTPHGGKLKYLARMDFKRDICVLCHENQF